jgi:hypothetical protein
MSQPLDIIIVERLGGLKTHSIKDFKPEQLYTKCGFKKADNFGKQTEWTVKYDGKKYVIQVYAKTDGRANTENKYEFPPPIDNKLFFGSCAIIAQLKKDSSSNHVYTNLTLPMWNKIYEKLYGGFEDLAATAKEDEEEEDELVNVPKEMKTKDGYLKDGFVVDSSDAEDETATDFDDEDEAEYDEDDDDEDDGEMCGDDIVVDDAGSELSEESYDYDDDAVGK